MISSELTNILDAGRAASPATLQVDVIADLICPWCYLGKRRLDEALEAVRGPSEVTWYPFQINPDMPAAGMPLDEYLEKKFGNLAALQPAMDELKKLGKAEGIEFNFDKVQRVPSTLDAHRLMQLGQAEDVSASNLAESILRGFFENGLDIADRDVLIEIGGNSGLSRNDVNNALDNDDSRRIVLSREEHVRQSGVTGVPDFLVNKRLFAVGAQSTENLIKIFDRAMFGNESDMPISEVVH
ncbi:MAG: DsbA family oxidoreductase [Woeseiaceae bacterium]|nr:DsbA family oxidoreductase [Woeseiaceae bacterium]